jgi:TBC1 domain family protein 5
MRYFQEEDVRTKLTDILFCYARENEQLLYKQVASLYRYLNVC